MAPARPTPDCKRTHQRAPGGLSSIRQALRPAVRQFDASAAKSAYLKSP